MKRSTLLTLLCVFVLIPGTMYVGTLLKGRWYYAIGTLMVLEAMAPFFMNFEARKPRARELVTLGVMAALAAVSRGAFAFLPHFKPIVAIVMITGMAFGPQAGFLTGAISAFASNFFFGQGPFTPWQMMSYGLGGFLAGLLLYDHGWLSARPLLHRVLMGIFGFLTIVLLVGPVLDLCTVFTMSSSLSWDFAMACFAAGFPVNLLHGISCALTLFLLGPPLLGKLDRLKKKYGILGENGQWGIDQ